MRNLIFFIGLYFLSINHIFSSDIISNCDLVASDPFDLQNPLIIEEKIEGTLTQDLINEDYRVLVDACKADLNKTIKNKVRYSYQLARIYYAFEEYELSEPLFNFSESKGYIAASYYLGSIDFHDPTDNLFDKDTIEYFKKSYEGGYSVPSSLSYLADTYYYLKDFKNAEKYYLIFLKDFELNDPVANYITDILVNLSDIYYSQDMYAEASIYFRKTINRYKDFPKNESLDNYLFALSELAFIYFNGLGGIPVNYEKSFVLYNELINADVNKDYTTALNQLSIMYNYGMGTEQDYFKSFKLLRKSIDISKDILAYNNIQTNYLYGIGVEQNIEEAKKINLKILELDPANFENGLETFLYFQSQANDRLKNWDDFINTEQWQSTENICDWIYNETSEIKKNLVYSFQKCLELAVSGDQWAMEVIAYIYESGEGVPQNTRESYKWYSILSSLEPSNEFFLFKKGTLRLNGKVKDKIDLANLFNKLTINKPTLNLEENYYADANFYLGQAYRYGITTSIDLDKAISHFQKVLEIAKEVDDKSYYLIEKSSKNISEIKSIQAGYSIERDLTLNFPAEFIGNFNWEGDDYVQKFSSIKFNQLERLGINNYLLTAEGIHEDGHIIKLKGELNKNDLSFKLFYDYLDEDIPPDLYGFDLRGDFLGFFNEDFTNASSWYTKGSGYGNQGLFTLTNFNTLENLGSKDQINQVEKLNINFGNYYAVIIGNQNYDNLIDLDTPIIDAQSIASLLENKYGFEILDIILDGTRSDILSKLNNLKNTLQPYDNLLIYYAGHGHYDVAERGYWLPKDANTVESDDNTNWIPNDDITNLLSKINAKHILVIADSCFSGSLTFRGASNTKNREKLFTNLVTQKTRKALTSGKLEPVLDGGGKGHSIFANNLLKVLSENKLVLDVNSLFVEIKNLVSSSSNQTPTYGPIRDTGDEGGDFIFVPAY